jgi:hypothetical protein
MRAPQRGRGLPSAAGSVASAPSTAVSSPSKSMAAATPAPASTPRPFAPDPLGEDANTSGHSLPAHMPASSVSTTILIIRKSDRSGSTAPLTPG